MAVAGHWRFREVSCGNLTEPIDRGLRSDKCPSGFGGRGRPPNPTGVRSLNLKASGQNPQTGMPKWPETSETAVNQRNAALKQLFLDSDTSRRPAKWQKGVTFHNQRF